MPTRAPHSAILLIVVLGCISLPVDRTSGQEPVRGSTPGVALTGESDNSPERVFVRESDVLSAYGAPVEFSGSRFASLTNAYVLPPGVVYAGLIYQGDALRFSQPNHLFTQEVEVGLPHRFNIAIENSIQSFAGYTQESTVSIEVRYALADWNKIPLNPTIFVEYKKGIGYILHDEGAAMRAPPGEPAIPRDKTRIPDAGEVRLLLAQEFPAQVEWTLNLFFEQEIRGDRGREWGFAQSILRPVLLPREQLKVGVEMQYSNFTDKDSRKNPVHRFVVGPTMAWKPTRRLRFDLSPLFGTTYNSPRVEVFAVISYLFGGKMGGSEEHETEAPASTRNR